MDSCCDGPQLNRRSPTWPRVGSIHYPHYLFYTTDSLVLAYAKMEILHPNELPFSGNQN